VDRNIIRYNHCVPEWKETLGWKVENEQNYWIPGGFILHLVVGTMVTQEFYVCIQC